MALYLSLHIWIIWHKLMRGYKCGVTPRGGLSNSRTFWWWPEGWLVSLPSLVVAHIISISHSHSFTCNNLSASLPSNITFHSIPSTNADPWNEVCALWSGIFNVSNVWFLSVTSCSSSQHVASELTVIEGLSLAHWCGLGAPQFFREHWRW